MIKLHCVDFSGEKKSSASCKALLKKYKDAKLIDTRSVFIDMYSQFYEHARTHDPLLPEVKKWTWTKIKKDTGAKLKRVHFISSPRQEVLGFIVYSVVKGNIAFIDYLFVKPEHRRKGVASKALDAVRNEAQVAKCKCVYIGCAISNTSALSLYESKGYKKLIVDLQLTL